MYVVSLAVFYITVLKATGNKYNLITVKMTVP